MKQHAAQAQGQQRRLDSASASAWALQVDAIEASGRSSACGLHRASTQATESAATVPLFTVGREVQVDSARPPAVRAIRMVDARVLHASSALSDR